MPHRFLYPPPMLQQWPDLILLDLDGTLVDSFPAITEALNRALGVLVKKYVSGVVHGSVS